MLKDLLEKNICFKLVCGAGNEDIEEIKRLVYIYSLAGCKFFDLSANTDVIKSAKDAIKLANIKDAYLCVSVGIKNDPHVTKAVIDQTKCINCGACEAVCAQSAIHNGTVKKVRCIGCGRCWKSCSRMAISYISEEKNLKEVLPPIIDLGIDCIEFHAMGNNEKEINAKWQYINEIFDGILSICTSRGKLSDEDLVNRIKKMTKNRKPYSTIIQADGFPMSGGEDDYKSTLQAVATAEIVYNEKLPLYIMLSGGTNTKTSNLAKMCNINYNGIAVGSYARKIIKKYIDSEDFWINSETIDNAVQTAKKLVNTVVI